MRFRYRGEDVLAKTRGKAGQIAEGLTKLDLVILDVLACLDLHVPPNYKSQNDPVSADVLKVRVPRDGGHRFHAITGTDSTRSRAVIPRDGGQV